MKNVSEEVCQLLTELGFSQAQQRVYLLLIVSGPMARPNLLTSLRTLKPTEIDDAVNQLSALQLVAQQHTKSTIRIAATRPRIAWRWQLMDLVWRHGKSEPSERVEAVPALDDPKLQRRRQIYHDLGMLLDPLMNPMSYAATGPRRGRAFVLGSEYAYACAEAISTAKVKIFACERPPRLPHLPLFWTALTDRLEAKIPYTRCVCLDELLHHGVRIVRRDTLTLGIDLHVTARSNLARSFYLIDDSHILVKDWNQPDSGASVFGFLSFQPQLIERYRRNYGHHALSTARPAAEVLPILEAWVKQRTVKAFGLGGHGGQRVYENIANYGRFANFESGDDKLVENLISHRLLSRHHDGAVTLATPVEGPLASLA